MKKLSSSLMALYTLSVLTTGCIKIDTPFKGKSHHSNYVSNKGKVNQQIGDEDVQLQIMSPSVVAQKETVVTPNSELAKDVLEDAPQGNAAAESIADEKAKAASDSLLLGFPIGLLGEQNVFGGVITKVTDKESETLGGLKLTDLSPIHVTTQITGLGTDSPALTLVGCVSQCDEDAAQGSLVSFPIVGVDRETNQIILDLAPIGRELDLVTMMDPSGEYTQLKAIESTTTAFDYSQSTLVFDIKTKFIPVGSQPTDADVKVTEITVRWYLRLNSAFNPAFTARAPTEGVGFFKTERSKNTKITRFSTTGAGQSVKYYIKNVPAEYQAHFAKALKDWNAEFKAIIGKELLDYEFIPKDDPRNEALVPGDIRYNIIEWDLENKAGYGGLGPSIANQFTGETLSANVLIQGPTIIQLYTKWFALSQEVHELRAQGQLAEADQLVRDFHVATAKEMAKRNQQQFKVKLGKSLELNVRSQTEELEDPIVKNHFEVVPKGVKFEDYMAGYFNEMLAHELGHNVGLRHNFKGNLGAIENGGEGSVSRSIMEYLGRPFRHLNRIGLYDRMAISYGYRGIAPKHLDWFCTDEDQATNPLNMLIRSPECTKSDATSDPYSFWEKRIDRTIELLVAPSDTRAPVWKVEDVKSQIDEFSTALSSYALSAERTFATWTNFTGKGDRPETAEGVKPYVLASLKRKLCDANLAPAILAKESEEARKLAEDNLADLRKAVAAKTSEYLLFTSEDLSCN